MTQKNAVLKKLFTNEGKTNTEDLFKILSPFVKIDKATKKIIFLDEAHSQPLKNKLLLFLLAKKALFLLEEIETDKVKPKVIIEETGAPRGSVLPNLMLLRGSKGGNLVSAENGAYYISNYQIAKIKVKNILNIKKYEQTAA